MGERVLVHLLIALPFKVPFLITANQQLEKNIVRPFQDLNKIFTSFLSPFTSRDFTTGFK